MPPALLAEIILCVAGLAAIAMIRNGPSPAALFWAVGIGTVAVAALFGALVYLGVDRAMRPYDLMSGLASGVGLVALVLGGLFGLVLPPPQQSWRLLVAALAVALLTVIGLRGLPTFGVPLILLALGAMLIIALIGLKTRPAAARWLLAALAVSFLAEGARRGYLGVVRLRPNELHHFMLAGALLCFGQTARHAN